MRAIEADEALRAALGGVTGLRLDLTDDRGADVRAALGVPLTQPYIAIGDATGRVRPDLAVDGPPHTGRLASAIAAASKAR